MNGEFECDSRKYCVYVNKCFTKHLLFSTNTQILH